MTVSADSSPVVHPRLFGRRIDPLWVLAGAALSVATLLHFQGLDRPLWLDEAGTGGVAAQESLGAVLRLCLSDVNAPLYYVLAHFWAEAFGLSDVALRLPSAIFAGAAAWIAVARGNFLDKETRLCWALLLAFWIPGLSYAADARCYALLFFLATLNAVTFARLVVTLEWRAAFAWAVVGLLLILTHYHALLLIGTQTVILLARHRGKAVSLWPVLFIFLPALIWMGLHLPVIRRYLDPRAAWYWPLKFRDLGRVLAFLANARLVAVFALLLTALVFISRTAEAPRNEQSRGPLWLIALASLLPALAIIAMGFVRPSFASRYLVAFSPGILFGLALLAREAKPHWKLAPFALLFAFAIPALAWLMGHANYRGNPYSFERASQALIRAGTQRLVFFWDNPNTQVMDPRFAAAFGGFFFTQASVPIEVIPIRLRLGEDPNLRLAKEAEARHAAILWVYDTLVDGTAARVHPVKIAARDPAWSCQNFGNARFGIIACRRLRKGTQSKP